MSSYEKQMQWKKASAVKAKKDKEDRAAAGESYSFTPVMYTSSSHAQKDNSERHSSEAKPPRVDRSRRESSGRDVRPVRSIQDSDLYSPMRGSASVNSHQNSEAGTHSASGYGNAYAEHLVARGYDDHYSDGNNRHHRHREDNRGNLDNADEDVGEEEEERSQENSRPLRATLSRSSSNQQHERGGGDCVGNRRRSQGSSKFRSNHRESGMGQRPGGGRGGRDSPESSLDGSSGGEDEDEADEPIIELLERERKQWREEREKLIQCIHLQQLELSQRSVAAHERAADIAKEFARAIECFEERLVSVEGTVQKEIMSIKTIAESLLHAAQAQSSPHAGTVHGGGSSTASNARI